MMENLVRTSRRLPVDVTLVGMSAALLSALSPTVGAEVTDAEYGQSAAHCIKIDYRKEAGEAGNTRAYFRNTCNKELTLFWCEPGGSLSVTKCRQGPSWPSLDSNDIDFPLHKRNYYYSQGVGMKPLATYNILLPKNSFRYAACFGIRAVAEWFSSERDGTYYCYPKRPGLQHSQRKRLARYVQERLTALGYDPGPIDGDAGPRTNDAIRRFQSAAGLSVDGEISSTLLMKLRTARKRAQRRQAAAKEKRLYGSIAFWQGHNGRFAWGMSWNSGSGTRARRGALRACRVYTDICSEVAKFRNTCAALAVSDGAGFATAGGDTTAAAERAALSKCRDGRTNCRIEVSRCAKPQGGSYRGTGTRTTSPTRVAKTAPATGAELMIIASHRNDAWGLGWGNDNLSAHRAAVADCKKRGGCKDLYALESIRSGCVALAHSTLGINPYDSLLPLGLVQARTKSEAERFASEACEKAVYVDKVQRSHQEDESLYSDPERSLQVRKQLYERYPLSRVIGSCKGTVSQCM